MFSIVGAHCLLHNIPIMKRSKVFPIDCPTHSTHIYDDYDYRGVWSDRLTVMANSA